MSSENITPAFDGGLDTDEPELPPTTWQDPPEPNRLPLYDKSVPPVPWKPAPEEVEAYRSYDPVGASLEDLGKIARVLAQSGYFKDARDVAQCMAKILAGRELGIGPFQSVSQYHVVEGKPSMSAGLVGAMVKRSGRYDYKVRTRNEEECVLDWYQDGELVGDSAFSMADAQRAKLIRAGSGWEKYPRSMLFARALTDGARTHCPDVFGGAIYTPDELSA